MNPSYLYVIASLDVDFHRVVYEVETGMLSPFSQLQNLRVRIALRFNIKLLFAHFMDFEDEQWIT